MADDMYILIDDMPDTPLNVKQAADIVGVTTMTIYKMLKEKVLTSIGDGDTVRISLKECLFVNKMQVKHLRDRKYKFERFLDSEFRNGNTIKNKRYEN